MKLLRAVATGFVLVASAIFPAALIWSVTSEVHVEHVIEIRAAP